MPCRINVFPVQKRERSPRENPPKGDFGGFSHGDLSPRQANIRQTVAENLTHGMSRTFVWRGERSPCENTKKSPFGGFSRGDLSRYRPCLSYLCLAGRKVASHAQFGAQAYVNIIPQTQSQGFTLGGNPHLDKRYTKCRTLLLKCVMITRYTYFGKPYRGPIL